MRVITDNINTETFGNDIEYVFLGDLHIGNSNCAYDELRDSIKILSKKDNARIILIGDLIDCITHKDKRFDAVEIADHYKIKKLKDLPVAQVDELIGIIEPIKDKIIAMVYGNHEYKYMQYNSFDPLNYFNGKLGINAPILGKKGYIVSSIRSGDNKGSTWVLACLHGRGGGGRTAGYKLNVTDAEFLRIIADCKVMGHIHQQSADYMDYETVNTSGDHKIIKMMRMWYGSNGCYLYKSKEDTEAYFEDAPGSFSSIGYLTYKINYNYNKQNSDSELIRKDYKQHI